MGVTTWNFEWDGADWRRRQAKWMDRLFAGTERLEGQAEILLAEVPVELLERVPVGVGQPRFHRWPLMADGTLGKDEIMQRVALAMPQILPLHESTGNVIEAEDRFNRRRHKATAHWEPSSAQLALLVTALKKAGMGPRVAALVEH